MGQPATAADLLNNFDQEYRLGDNPMDATHREFLTLARQTADASGTVFIERLQQLLAHTDAHFASEEARMAELNHGLLAEHRADHQRILGDMSRFSDRAAVGRIAMAKAWVRETLPAWFHTHAKTMDSALAADIRKSSQ